MAKIDYIKDRILLFSIPIWIIVIVFLFDTIKRYFWSQVDFFRNNWIVFNFLRLAPLFWAYLYLMFWGKYSPLQNITIQSSTSRILELFTLISKNKISTLFFFLIFLWIFWNYIYTFFWLILDYGKTPITYTWNCSIQWSIYSVRNTTYYGYFLTFWDPSTTTVEISENLFNDLGWIINSWMTKDFLAEIHSNNKCNSEVYIRYLPYSKVIVELKKINP